LTVLPGEGEEVERRTKKAVESDGAELFGTDAYERALQMEAELSKRMFSGVQVKIREVKG
jgi:hypothetical protein